MEGGFFEERIIGAAVKDEREGGSRGEEKSEESVKRVG